MDSIKKGVRKWKEREDEKASIYRQEYRSAEDKELRRKARKDAHRDVFGPVMRAPARPRAPPIRAKKRKKKARRRPPSRSYREMTPRDPFMIDI